MRWLWLWTMGSLALAAGPTRAFAQEVEAATVLDAIDANMTSKSRSNAARMTVVTPKRTRVYEMKTWGRGSHEAAIEYLAPAREKGTKMLRKGPELWMFLPAIERTQKISGHALRQGLSGSDVSYEDMTSAETLRDAYTAKVTATEEHGGRPCHKLELEATDKSTTYARRVIWVDKEWMVPVRQELYAVSGLLLKTWEMSEVQKIGERWVPHQMVVTDEVKKGSKTTIELSEITFDAATEDEVFTQRWLER